MKEVTITRQELYDLVWTESMLALSKKYAISDVGLRKKCRSLQIPIPNAGYWAKVKFGKKVIQRIPLEAFNGDQTVILHLRDETDPSKEARSNLLRQIESDVSINLKVPEKLTSPDNLIIAFKNDIYKSKVWDKNEGTVYNSSGHLSISVSPKNLGRALLFMDTLIKALKRRGHKITIENHTTYFIIEGEKIPVWLREKHTRVLVKGTHYDSYENQSTGLLSLKIDESYSNKEWSDGNKKLEEQLPKILVDLEMRGRRLKEKRLERERYWEEQREKDRKAKEIFDRKEKELKNFLELFRNAKRHHNAEKIRRYADELEKFALVRNIITDDFRVKIEWARKKADWYDPFIEADDELMAGIDRDDLRLEKQIFPWLK